MTPQTARQTLLTRRAELTKHLNTLEDQLDDEPPKDFEDRSSERQGDEVLEALGQAELNEIKRIDAALARIADGTYGTCQTCGNPISPERLAVLPATPLCKTCAAGG